MILLAIDNADMNIKFLYNTFKPFKFIIILKYALSSSPVHKILTVFTFSGMVNNKRATTHVINHQRIQN